MAALAPLDAGTPLTLTAFFSSPARMILAREALPFTRPAFLRLARSTVSPSTRARSARRTSAAFSMVTARKPRFGRRRWSGICPPSKPTLWKPPARDFWPLWPRPAVLPRPEPTPRATRLRFFLEPAAGLMSFSSMLALDFHEVAHLVDHAADGRGVLHLDGVHAMAQAQALHRLAVLADRRGRALHQGDADLLARRGGLLSLLAHVRILSRRSLRPSCRAWPRFPTGGAAAGGRRAWRARRCRGWWSRGTWR